jgi:hypothetical protein
VLKFFLLVLLICVNIKIQKSHFLTRFWLARKKKLFAWMEHSQNLLNFLVIIIIFFLHIWTHIDRIIIEASIWNNSLIVFIRAFISERAFFLDLCTHQVLLSLFSSYSLSTCFRRMNHQCYEIHWTGLSTILMKRSRFSEVFFFLYAISWIYVKLVFSIMMCVRKPTILYNEILVLITP